MINYDEFLRINEPAFGESEKDYFMRLSFEYKLLQKAEARKQLKALWAQRLRSLIKFVDAAPNLFHHKSA